MTLLLDKKQKNMKNPKTKASSSKRKGKEKEGENSTSEIPRVRTTSDMKTLSLHLKRKGFHKTETITLEG